jgi:hypothetical protein
MVSIFIIFLGGGSLLFIALYLPEEKSQSTELFNSLIGNNTAASAHPVSYFKKLRIAFVLIFKVALSCPIQCFIYTFLLILYFIFL